MSNTFQTCLKGFKLKKMIVDPKTAQPVESDEELIELDKELVESDKELIDLFSSIGWEVQKLSLSSRTLIQPVKGRPRSNYHLTCIKC